MRVLKRWTREFEARVQPLVKQMEKLHTLLSNDLVKGAAYLAQAIDILSAYAGTRPALAERGAAPAPAADEPTVSADVPADPAAPDPTHP